VEGLSNFSGLRKFRRRIEVWRDEHKDPFCSLKGNGERGLILYCGKSYLATLVLPDLTFLRIPHDSAHRLAACQECASDCAANFTSYSGDSIHVEFPITVALVGSSVACYKSDNRDCGNKRNPILDDVLHILFFFGARKARGFFR
jgi:hypothetical protein